MDKASAASMALCPCTVTVTTILPWNCCRQEEWNLKHKDKASAASMERVQHFGESFAKIQEATGKPSVTCVTLVLPRVTCCLEDAKTGPGYQYDNAVTVLWC